MLQGSVSRRLLEVLIICAAVQLGLLKDEILGFGLPLEMRKIRNRQKNAGKSWQSMAFLNL